MVVNNQSIEDAIDAAFDGAICAYHPALAEAASISALIQDLVRKAVDYLATYGMQSSKGFAWKAAITPESYESAIRDIVELSELVTLIQCSINSATNKAMAIVRSAFPEDLKAYSQCMGSLSKFISSDPKSLAHKTE